MPPPYSSSLDIYNIIDYDLLEKIKHPKLVKNEFVLFSVMMTKYHYQSSCLASSLRSLS